MRNLNVIYCRCAESLVGKISLFLARKKALQVFRTVLPIGFRSSLQERITDLGHAASLLCGDPFKILFEVGSNPECEPEVFFHRGKF